MTSSATPSSSTKDFGQRRRLPLRFAPATTDAAEQLAQLIPTSVNTIFALGVLMLSAQFAPLLVSRGLSLDLLEEEMRSLFADARRVVETRPAEARNVPK